jgi:threonine/homoserine/homoserine lactone efflux protein
VPIQRRCLTRPTYARARGGLTNLSNPKAAIFNASVFAAKLPADASFCLRSAAVALILVNALAWHALVAIALSTPRAQHVCLRFTGWIDRVVGTALTTFGVLVITDLR